jgi:transcriptional regulator with XRE-family HTH domain
MKRTLEDDEFAAEFGRRLKAHYDASILKTDKGKGPSDEKFAASLDVSRAALKKYLAGEAMPTVRTAVLAYHKYGINIPYLGTPLFSGKTRTKGRVSTEQLILPFSVRSLSTATIQARVQPKGLNQFEVRVTVDS